MPVAAADRGYLRRANNKIKTIVHKVKYIARPTAQLVCRTLDYDDVLIAQKQLKNHRQWIDSSIESEFAKKFSQWNQSKYAFPFLSGRASLSACIFALGLMPGDEVIVPGFTCIVVPNAFDFAQVKVVYCDIELETYGLDVEEIKKHITPKTKAILLHHLFGLVCRDYMAIIELARRNNLYVIEDCAHSTGAFYKGTRVGNYGDLAFYSSELSKIFNTIQGGVVTTNDSFLAKGLSRFYEHAPYPDFERIENQLHNVIVNYYRFKHPLRNHLGIKYELRYKDKIYDSTTEEEIMGIKPKDYGCKMPAAISLLAINQLSKIDYYNRKRRQAAKRWDAWCVGMGYQKPKVVEHSAPVFLRYPILVDEEKKRDLSWSTKNPKITPGRWFLTNLHPVKRVVPGCPNADKAVRQCINFPTLL
ncbi:MAG: aminotransferase class I/II-fold pyridoxal phosphate-dependent enzyme [Candidatus Omnitrophica bacterium]|nr:aminotransferase class I/II-fold pyridoxal phosphate-dependent enzyme [Candidatus Omnitrophota bacterium]